MTENFRSNYLGKVGIKKVDEKKSIEHLLKENPRDHDKLCQCCLKLKIPVSFRLLLWKLILGIYPLYEKNKEFVWQQRVEQYQDLRRALEVMKFITPKTPQELAFYHMYNINKGEIPLTLPNKMDDFKPDSTYLALATAFTEVSEDPVDIFFLSFKIYDKILAFEETSEQVRTRTEYYLQKEDDELHKHFTKLSAISVLPLDKWFFTALVGTLPDSAFIRICDKVVGGSSKIIIYASVAILLTLKHQLIKMKNKEDIQKYLQKIPEDAGDSIVDRAFNIWERYGSQLMPIRAKPSHQVTLD